MIQSSPLSLQEAFFIMASICTSLDVFGCPSAFKNDWAGASAAPKREYNYELSESAARIGVSAARLHVAGEIAVGRMRYEPNHDDDVKIVNHATAAALMGKSQAEKISLAENVFYLHVIDDIVDAAAAIQSERSRSIFGFLLYCGMEQQLHDVFSYRIGDQNETRVFLEYGRELPELQDLIIAADLMEDSLVARVTQSRPEEFNFQRRRTLREDLNDKLEERLKPIYDSIFHILAGAADKMSSSNIDGYGIVMEDFKHAVLSRLRYPGLADELDAISPKTFMMVSKATVHALMGVEGQPYSEDRALVWTMIYSPYFYNFNKERAEHQAVDQAELMAAVNTAFQYVGKIPDDRLPQRIEQLNYIVNYWPRSFPNDLYKVYLHQLMRLKQRQWEIAL